MGGELPIEDAMQWQRDYEKEQAAATRPPFPTEDATALLTPLQDASALDQVPLDAMKQIVSWASEDSYRDSLFELGGAKLLLHVLDLCAHVTGTVSEDLTTLRDLTILAVAESLHSSANMQAAEVPALVPLLSTLLQGGPSEFPVNTTTMNLTIQATADVIRALAAQKQIKLISQLTDPQILQAIRPYLRDDDIYWPTQPDRAVPSLMCTSRFVMSMAVLGPAFVSRMEKAGFVETLQNVQPRNSRVKQILLGCFMMMGRSSQVRECDRCSKKEDPAHPFMMCSRCKSRRYCSKQCQVEAWKGAHSRECKNLVAAREQSS